MPEIPVAQLIAVFLAGLLAGNETGTLVAVHPALSSLELEPSVHAERAVTRAYGRTMPFLMIATLLAGVLAATQAGERAWLYGAGAIALLAMLATTFSGNMPINRRVLAGSGISRQDWTALRRRWWRFHALRVALDLIAFALYLIAAVDI